LLFPTGNKRLSPALLKSKTCGKQHSRIHVVRVCCWLTRLLISAKTVNQQPNQQQKLTGQGFPASAGLLFNFFDFSLVMKKSEKVKKYQSLIRRCASVKIKILNQQASS